MKGLIVEDIKPSSDMIKNRIMKLSNEFKQIDQAYDLEEAYVKIESSDYDVLFLDVNLPRGTSFDLLKQLSEEEKIDFELIFITGQKEKEHLIDAIKFSAIDFLYKPLEDEQLMIAIQKATSKIKSNVHQEQVKVLLDLVMNEGSLKDSKVAFHLPKGKTIFLKTNEISHMIGEGSICKIYLANGQMHNAIRNIGFYKTFLQEQCDFIMVSKGTLVNPNYVKSYSHANLSLVLIDDTEIICSRRGGKTFKSFFANQRESPNLWNRIVAFLNN